VLKRKHSRKAVLFVCAIKKKGAEPLMQPMLPIQPKTMKIKLAQVVSVHGYNITCRIGFARINCKKVRYDAYHETKEKPAG
jgi:hypothetical protein